MVKYFAKRHRQKRREKNRQKTQAICKEIIFGADCKLSNGIQTNSCANSSLIQAIKVNIHLMKNS